MYRRFIFPNDVQGMIEPHQLPGTVDPTLLRCSRRFKSTKSPSNKLTLPVFLQIHVKSSEISIHLNINFSSQRPFQAARIAPNDHFYLLPTCWHLCSTFLGPKKHDPKSTQKHEVSLMVFIENQTIAFLTLKMKTSIVVYINSK